MDGVVSKVCSVCGTDVSSRKRSKNLRGEYFCEPCLAVLRSTAAVAVAAAGQKDPGPEPAVDDGPLVSTPSRINPQTNGLEGVAAFSQQAVGPADAVRELIRRRKGLLLVTVPVVALLLVVSVVFVAARRAAPVPRAPSADTGAERAGRHPAGEVAAASVSSPDPDRLLAARVCGEWESLTESDGERYAFVLTIRADGTWSRTADLARCSPNVVQFVRLAGAERPSHGTYAVSGGQCLATVTHASISAVKVGQVERIELAADASSLTMGQNPYRRTASPPPTAPLAPPGVPAVATPAAAPASWSRMAALLGDDGSLIHGSSQHGALFKAGAGAQDESLVVAAEGSDGDHLEWVLLSVRLRRDDPAAGQARLAQACGLAREVTGGHVEPAEFDRWVADCLRDVTADPVERGGWVIKVRNFRQLGYMDAMPHRGTPVVVELHRAGTASKFP